LIVTAGDGQRERGYYLHPELFGQPTGKAIGVLRRPPVPADRNGQSAAQR
jgi:hypothetical protein